MSTRLRADPGAMNEPVAIQAKTDGEWADVPEWSTVWVEERPLSGTEEMRAMQPIGRTTYRLRTWALEGVRSTQHRIRRHRDDAVLEIIAPPRYDPMRLFMELTVSEREATS